MHCRQGGIQIDIVMSLKDFWDINSKLAGAFNFLYFLKLLKCILWSIIAYSTIPKWWLFQIWFAFVLIIISRYPILSLILFRLFRSEQIIQQVLAETGKNTRKVVEIHPIITGLVKPLIQSVLLIDVYKIWIVTSVLFTSFQM